MAKLKLCRKYIHFPVAYFCDLSVPVLSGKRFFIIFGDSKRTDMKKILFTLIIMFLGTCVYAQRQNFMYPDKKSMEFFDSVKFVNPAFYPGVAVYKDGKQGAATMNICTIDQRIHFLDSQGDTLVIKHNEEVDRAYIIGKAYVNSKYGYVQILETAGNISLCELKEVEMHVDAPTGAYGLRTQTSTVKTLTSMDLGGDGTFSGRTMNLEKERENPFAYSRKPFFLVKGNVIPATKKLLLKHFPDKKAFIEEYVKEHDTNFNAVDPVMELFKELMK